MIVEAKVKCIEDGTITDWNLEDILKEINRDRSDEWIDHDASDWFEGWNEWIDGQYYLMVSFEQFMEREDFESWTADELFNYLQGMCIISEDEEFEDWKHDRTDMIDMCVDGLEE